MIFGSSIHVGCLVSQGSSLANRRPLSVPRRPSSSFLRLKWNNLLRFFPSENTSACVRRSQNYSALIISCGRRFLVTCLDSLDSLELFTIRFIQTVTRINMVRLENLLWNLLKSTRNLSFFMVAPGPLVWYVCSDSFFILHQLNLLLHWDAATSLAN